LVTPGDAVTWSPLRAADRLPRVTHVPLGVPVGPGTGPLLATDSSKIDVWSAPVSSKPPMR